MYLDAFDMTKKIETEQDAIDFYAPKKWIATHDFNYVKLLQNATTPEVVKDSAQLRLHANMIDAVHFGAMSASVNDLGELQFELNLPN